MSYRPVDETFWTDPKVRSLNSSEKMLFLYFITNPHANFCGIYYLPMPTVEFETAMPKKELLASLETLKELHMVLHDDLNSIFWVRKMAKHQMISEKQRNGAHAQIKKLQNSPLIKMFSIEYPGVISRDEYPMDRVSDGYQYPTDKEIVIGKGKDKEIEEEIIVPWEKAPAKKTSTKLTDEQFMEALKNNQAYSHIDFDREIGKIDAWLMAHPGRQKTRKFIINWLNKIEKPMAAAVEEYDDPIPPPDLQIEFFADDLVQLGKIPKEEKNKVAAVALKKYRETGEWPYDEGGWW